MKIVVSVYHGASHAVLEFEGHHEFKSTACLWHLTGYYLAISATREPEDIFPSSKRAFQQLSEALSFPGDPNITWQLDTQS